MMKFFHNLNPYQIVLLSYGAIIMIGTFLLMLPISVKPFNFSPRRESRARFSLLRFTRSISRGHPSLSRQADEVVSVQAERPALAVSEIFACRI